MDGGVFWPRKFCADCDDAAQGREERVRRIRAIKTVITVRSTVDEAEGAQLAEFILNRVESKTAQVHQFADVTLLERCGEERAQEFGPNSGKQDLQNCAFRLHPATSLDSTALSRRVSFAGCKMHRDGHPSTAPSACAAFRFRSMRLLEWVSRLMKFALRMLRHATASWPLVDQRTLPPAPGARSLSLPRGAAAAQKARGVG